MKPEIETRATTLANLKTKAIALAHQLMTPQAEPLGVKDRCRRRTKTLQRSGRLVKLPCEACGAAEVVAHHENYRRPDHVRWVCRRCHHAVHHRGSVLPLKLPPNPSNDDISRWIAVGVLQGLALWSEMASKQPSPAPPPPVLAPQTIFVTLTEAAVITGLSCTYLRKAIKSGELPCMFKERRNSETWRIKRTDLEAL